MSEDHRHEDRRLLAPPRPGDVDLTSAPHPVPIQIGLDGFARLVAAREHGHLVQEVLTIDIPQERDNVRERADHICHVQQREPHLRGDIPGHGLRERVGHVLLAQPLPHVLVQPPTGLRRGGDHLQAARIEGDPPQLREVRQDELDQLRSGLRLDRPLQRGGRLLASLDQLAHDRRIGIERLLLGECEHPSELLVRTLSNEVAALHDRPQRVTHQRVGPPMARSSPARGVGLPSISVTSTKSLPPATDIGRGVVSCHSESPSGLMGSVIICWCPTDT